ncbi:MAG: adenine deaminase [Acholeplasmataceae bacterium]|nr:adenine deaminase [Acholeplasmataceae bacterium]
MDTTKYLKKAKNLEKPELVLKNTKLINVYTHTIEDVDIAIEDGIIIGVGKYDGKREHDLSGFYVAPGFIDGHVHIESSMLTPPGFAKIVVPHGTTTVIADPHEIANVSGSLGVDFMLETSENIPLNVYMMIPSCVPATQEEHSGSVLTAKQIESYRNHPRVIGLGEVMDYPAVIRGNQDIHHKIRTMQGKIIDGHAPDILGYDLTSYILSGIMTDHECTMVESMIERIKQGMYVHLREGSATRNTKTLLKGLKKAYIPRTLFCTDDKHPEDIKQEGHINYNVNLAIASGMDPIDAISMATLNAATCYRLPHLGAIAPGKQADMIVFESLESINPVKVYHKGQLVAENQKPLFECQSKTYEAVLNTVNFNLDDLSFDISIKSNPVYVIGLIENNITTSKIIKSVSVEKGCFKYNPKEDVLKLAVIERHHMRKTIGLGLVQGFGIKHGAIAMTISHDSHNLIIVGTSDHDMRVAAAMIKEIQGGIVLVEHGVVTDHLQLEIGGIMTNKNESIVQESLSRMKEKIKRMGLSAKVHDPFISLAFLALPVIPKLKLTDRGLFDVEQFKIIPIEIEDKR